MLPARRRLVAPLRLVIPRPTAPALRRACCREAIVAQALGRDATTGGWLPLASGVTATSSPSLLPGCCGLHQVRGKKTKTVVNLEDLPQGRIRADDGAPDAPPPEESGPVYPTVIEQARRNMHKFSNCVLLTRVGGFYEMYFEHAEEYGPLLNLKVASKKTNAGPVPMVALSLSSPPAGSGYTPLLPLKPASF